MSKINNMRENIDILGVKWKLAPGGREVVEKSRERIWDLHIELAGYGALFRNINNCDFSADELYGVSLVLMQVSKRLIKIHEALGHATVEAKKQG